MRRAKEIWDRLRAWLSTSGAEEELSDELRFHIEEQTDANIRAGMDAVEARRQAMIAFGAMDRFQQECREERAGWLLDSILYDLRYGMRGLRRNPVFAVAVVATLALGIGAATGVFSVVDRLLFRSLPYAHADELVSVGLVAPIMPQEFMLGGNYYEWRDHQTPFAAFTSWISGNDCDLTEEKPLRMSCRGVEASFLPTLGIVPLLGRNFTAEEDKPNAPMVALISFGLWRSRFASAPDIVDKTISLDDQIVRVIGVLPRDFEFPTLERTDILVPEALDVMAQRTANPGRPMWTLARLKPGINAAQAKAALEPLFQQALLKAPAPFRKEVHLRVRPLRDRQMHDVRLLSWVLLGAVFAFLLIACANVANLLLARSAARQQETALRSALGASRARLIRQTLTESILLALGGAVAGLIVAEVLLQVFVAISPEGIPYLQRAGLDLRVVLFAGGLAIACGLLFGIVPALKYPRAEALAGRNAITAGSSSGWMVAAQIAVTMMLLACGGLLLRSLWKLESQPLGIRATSVLSARVELGGSRYPKPEQQMEFYERLEARLRRLPGVNTLAISDSLPPGGWEHDQIKASIRVEGRPLPTEGTGGLVAWRWVTPDYFRALNIPILRGRGFSEEERSSNDHFILVSQALASRMFPGEDAIGKRLQPGLEGPWYTIVGIAANAKNGGLANENKPEYYRLRRNRAEDWASGAGYNEVVITGPMNSEAMAQWVRSEVAALDPTVPVEIETMEQRVSKLAERPRFQAAVLSLFAAIALLLAAIGIYGMASYSVAQRTREIGVRMAVGATRSDVLRMVAARAARVIGTGGALGLIAALIATRILAGLLFGIVPSDPLTYGAIALLLIVVALLATWVPARSATRINPMKALRYE